MIYAKYFLFFFITIYLCVQSYSDIKTMKVPVFLNNIAVAVSLVFLIAGYVVTGTVIDKSVLPGALCILLFVLFRIYGKGDIKAMFAMFASSAFFGSGFSQPDSISFLVALLFGNILFYVIWKLYKMVTGSDRKKAPFFPYLVISYVAMFVLNEI